MILHALAEYYDRLADDPKSGVAPFGFSTERISYCLVLELDGRLHQIADLRENDGKKSRSRLMIVPDRGGRSGKALKPYFLWDNTGYVLGRDSKGKADRSRQMFKSFREFHEKLADSIGDDSLHAVCKFLKEWEPADAEKIAEKHGLKWEDIQDTNLIFQIRGERQYVHEASAICEAWVKLAGENADESRGLCLVSGGEESLARLHPMIQGVAGAQTTGAAIISFNLDAFESYGKEQSFNAPVGKDATFKYTTALNHLLSQRDRRVQLGDMTVIWWTEKPTEFEDAFGRVFDAGKISEDAAAKEQVKDFFLRLKAGLKAGDIKDSEIPFYILGLSPNASRISVRLWLQTTVGELWNKLSQHLNDLEMAGARDFDPPLTIRELLPETAREAKDIPPLLGGAMTRAVLTGGPYPDGFYSAVLRRVRADSDIRHRRAAILKAYLVRRWRVLGLKKEIPVSLDIDRRDPSYVLGRLFAALEKIQEDAAGGKLNRTVKDSYFGSAASTPAAIFPRLLRLSGHHQRGLPNEGQRVNHQKRLQEIHSKLDVFPLRLSNEEQGLFYIGYFHQRQDFFKPKSNGSDTEPSKINGKDDQ